MCCARVIDMNDFWLMIAVIVAGSAISLVGGAIIFLTKKSRDRAIVLALPFGAGALLAAAFFDLLPEAFVESTPGPHNDLLPTMVGTQELNSILGWTLAGFLAFFLLERSASWFHHHHEHRIGTQNHSRNVLVMIGDLLHNVIDGIAIATAFLVNPISGVITTLAVSAHEIPKELGTFGILLSRGWRDKTVFGANVLTAVGTLVAASLTYWFGQTVPLPEAELLAITSGFFIYIAASDIIPDIHEQPHRVGMLQAGVLLLGIVFVGVIVRLLGV